MGLGSQPRNGDPPLPPWPPRLVRFPLPRRPGPEPSDNPASRRVDGQDNRLSSGDLGPAGRLRPVVSRPFQARRPRSKPPPTRSRISAAGAGRWGSGARSGHARLGSPRRGPRWMAAGARPRRPSWGRTRSVRSTRAPSGPSRAPGRWWGSSGVRRVAKRSGGSFARRALFGLRCRRPILRPASGPRVRAPRPGPASGDAGGRLGRGSCPGPRAVAARAAGAGARARARARCGAATRSSPAAAGAGSSVAVTSSARIAAQSRAATKRETSPVTVERGCRPRPSAIALDRGATLWLTLGPLGGGAPHASSPPAPAVLRSSRRPSRARPATTSPRRARRPAQVAPLVRRRGAGGVARRAALGPPRGGPRTTLRPPRGRSPRPGRARRRRPSPQALSSTRAGPRARTGLRLGGEPAARGAPDVPRGGLGRGPRPRPGGPPRPRPLRPRRTRHPAFEKGTGRSQGR